MPFGLCIYELSLPMRPLAKNILYCVFWPFLFSLLLYEYFVEPVDIIYVVGSIPNVIIVILVDRESAFLSIISCIISVSLMLMPYVIYLVKKKEISLVYTFSSIYSLVSCLLGALIILGRYV